MTNLASTFKAIAPFATAAATIGSSFLSYKASKGGGAQAPASASEEEEDPTTNVAGPTEDQVKEAEVRRQQQARKNASGRGSTILTTGSNRHGKKTSLG